MANFRSELFISLSSVIPRDFTARREQISFVPLTAILSPRIDLRPVLKFVCVQFAVEILDALLQARLRIGDGMVINQGPMSSRMKLSSRPAGRSPIGSGRFSSK